MKKMISTMLAAAFTFTGLGLTGFNTVTASAAENDIYSIRTTATVLTQKEANDLNKAYKIEAGENAYDYAPLSAGDVRIDFYVTSAEMSELYVVGTYNESVFEPVTLPSSNGILSVFSQSVEDAKELTDSADGFVNTQNHLFSFGFLASGKNKTPKGHGLGSVFLKALVPVEDASTVLENFHVAVSEAILYIKQKNGPAEEVDLTQFFTVEELTVKFPPVPGDMDGDGKLKISDAVLMMRALCEGGLSTAAADAVLTDLNGDGYIDILDVCWLLDLLSNM